MSAAYKERSVTEQNAIDLCWNLLMHSEFNDLRNAIYGGQESELKRFRQVMVNAILATDLQDGDAQSARNDRWEEAFQGAMEEEIPEISQSRMNNRATLVIEHLMQAADIAHTMQHWHLYRKWSQRLFLEQHAAYRSGRCRVDPTETWFQSQLDLFSKNSVPVAQRLKESNVLGVSSGECLDYALTNLKQWQDQGLSVVEEFKDLVKIS